MKGKALLPNPKKNKSKTQNDNDKAHRVMSPLNVTASDYSDHYCQLYHIHGYDCVRATQVACVAANLSSGGAFVLITPKEVYLWKGRFYNKKELSTITGFLYRLMQNKKLTIVCEGEETVKFWTYFKTSCVRCECNRFSPNLFRSMLCTNCMHQHRPKGYKEEYGAVNKETTAMFAAEPRMFSCSTERGEFQADEIVLWSQQTLHSNISRCLLLDVVDHVFLWSGTRSVLVISLYLGSSRASIMKLHLRDQTMMKMMMNRVS